MKRFCGHCGSRLDEYGRCPVCEAKKRRRKYRKQIWIAALAVFCVAVLAVTGLHFAGVLASEPASNDQQETMGVEADALSGAAPAPEDALQEQPSQEESEAASEDGAGEEMVENVAVDTEVEEEVVEEPQETQTLPAEPIAVDQLPAGIPETLKFQSGAGGWWTELYLNQDGTFSGFYQDWNMGGVMPEMEQEAGQALPNGQCYRCDFSGRFSDIRKVSEVEYVMELTELTYLQEPGSHAVIDGAWFDYSEAYGLSGAKEVRLYLPGRATADIADQISGWLVIPHGLGELPEALEGWCLYNVETGQSFYGEAAEATQTTAEFWEAFVSSEEYLTYLRGWDSIGQMPNEYALLDIDGDGCEELLLNYNPGFGFSYYSVLCRDPASGEVTVAGIEEGWFVEDTYKPVAQHYSALSYSPKYHALAYAELNNGSYFDLIQYWTLEDTQLSVTLSVGFSRFPDTEAEYYLNHNGRTDLTEAEFQAVMDEREIIQFQPI